MIEALCESVTMWLLSHMVIDENDKELYQYAVHSFIMFIAPVFFTMFIGLIIGKFTEGIIFAIPFMFIRKFSGGYHATKEWICIVCSCTMIAVFLWILSYTDCDWKLHIIVMTAGFWLVMFSPIDSEAKRLDTKEKIQYKKVTGILVIVFILIYIGMCIGRMSRGAVYIAGGIIQTAVLQIPCVIRAAINRGLD